MRVKNKFIITAITPIIILGVLSVIIQVWTHSLFTHSVSVNVDKTKDIMRMEYLEAETRRNLLAYTLLHLPEEQIAYEQNIANFYTLLNHYKLNKLSAEETKYISLLENELTNMLIVEKASFLMTDKRIENIKQVRSLLTEKVEPLLENHWKPTLIQLNTESQNKLALLNNIELNIYKIMSAARGYLVYQDNELIELLEKSNKALNLNLTQLSKSNLTNQELTWLEQMNNDLNQINKVINSNIKLEKERTELMRKEIVIGANIKKILHDHLQTLSNTNLVNVENHIRNLSSLFILLLTFVVIVSVIGIWLLAQYFVKPIETLKNAIVKLRAGEDVTIHRVSNDEIGEVTNAFNDMIAENKARNNELAKQNWLKEHVSDILKTAQAENQLSVMCEKVLNKIATLLNAGSGAFYIVRIEKKSKDLVLMGTYAFNKRKNIANRFDFGEGLIGQAALEKKSIILSNVPDDYLTISSGLGERKPVNIAVYPIQLETKMLGVFELASFHEFTDIELQLLEQIAANIAVVIEAIQSRQLTEETLIQVQKQAEELQTQQEELRTANEELAEKTQRLQQSEEELQTQSEDLQVTNAELEEKIHAIELQKKEIEKKNKELGLAQLALEEKAKSLALAGKYKTEFLSNMSHELRTPLNSLLLLSKSFANNDDGNLTPQQIEEANIIYKGGKDLLELINDILDLSKVEAGKLSIQIEDVLLQSITEDLQRQFDPIANNKGIQFTVSYAIPKEIIIRTDAHRVKQILRNLISNAIKFTEKGSVTLHIEKPDANLKLNNINEDKAYLIVFKVIDTGIGIAKEKHNDIFEAFQQAYGNTDRIYGGTGLGLTISRELARLLDGEIQLESEPGKGSTFTLILPMQSKIKKAKENELEPVKKEVPAVAETNIQYSSLPDDRSDITSEDKVVLLIEDDADFLKTLVQISKHKNYKCLTALNGKTGLMLAKKYRPNGIILDLGLPDIDGTQVIEALKKDATTQSIPIHIISGHDQNMLPSTFKSIGFLKKPINTDDIDNIFQSFNSPMAAKILLIEDDKNYQKAIQNAVKNKKIEIVSASTGNEALKYLQEQHFDGLILDLKLPDMEGLELLKIAATKEITIPPIIVYSAKDLTNEEYEELHLFTSKIVRKDGDVSMERLLQECSLFLHAIKKADATNKAENLKTKISPDSILKDKTVLLADDDMRNVYALSRILQRSGMHVTAVGNGQEALDKLEETKPDIIIMDIMMPILDGYEAIRRIRAQKQYENLPIIAVTAKAMTEDRKACIEAGANDYLTKPIDDAKLLSLLRIWLTK